MNVSEILTHRQPTGFSFEVLPPLKGKSINQLFANIDKLMEFNPLYINITTHRSEMVFKSTADGLYRCITERSRPGTVAVATAIQQKYGVPAVPHIICSGFSKAETEYALIDLNFLGIDNLLILRGDKAALSGNCVYKALFFKLVIRPLCSYHAYAQILGKGSYAGQHIPLAEFSRKYGVLYLIIYLLIYWPAAGVAYQYIQGFLLSTVYKIIYTVYTQYTLLSTAK